MRRKGRKADKGTDGERKGEEGERKRGNKRVGRKKINVVMLQLPHATIIFFHSGNCVWKETFTRLSPMRNGTLVNVYRSLRCSLAGISHGRRCTRSWELDGAT